MAVYCKALVNIFVLLAYMYVPRQTLSIEIKNLKSSFEIRFYILVFFCEFWCWWLVWLYPHTLYVPSVTHPFTSNIYLGVALLPPPHSTHTQLNFPGIMIQTYLIEIPWQGKLFHQIMDSPQSDPPLSVHYLTGFWLFWNDLWRGFSFLFLFATRLWQSVTLLIADIRCGVKANDQPKTN